MSNILLTAAWCQACIPVKEYIKKHELDVELIDIDLFPECIEKYKVRSVPVLISGYKHVTGTGSIISYLGGMNAG